MGIAESRWESREVSHGELLWAAGVAFDIGVIATDNLSVRAMNLLVPRTSRDTQLGVVVDLAAATRHQRSRSASRAWLEACREIVRRASEQQREHDRQRRAGCGGRCSVGKMRTMEYMHRDHLQLSDAFTPCQQARPRPSSTPAAARVRSVAFAAGSSGAKLAQRALLDLPYPLAGQPDSLPDIS